MKKLLFTFLLSFSLVILLSGLKAYANAPDGYGPWADIVYSESQELRKDGTAVTTDREDSEAALGEAESLFAYNESPVLNSFFSLGFGGQIVLQFENGIRNGEGDDLKVYEVTGLGTYPDETALVYASMDGVTWTELETAIRDEAFDLGKLTCAQYIKIVDTSKKDLFEATADGFDLDAVEALYPGDCIPVFEGENSCSRGTMAVKIDELTTTVSATQKTALTITLPSAGEYLFEATGDYTFGGTLRRADAGYATNDGWSNLDSTLGLDSTYRRGVTSLLSDMGTGWIGIVDWGAWDTEHNYKFNYEVTDTSVQFVISDWWSDWYTNTCSNQSCMSDNTGSLTVNVYECVPDADEDGVPDEDDNCPSTYNPEQEDFDEDGTGDVCDSDADGDRVVDTSDHCLWTGPETYELGTNRVQCNNDGEWKQLSTKGLRSFLDYTIEDTYGCNCTQILDKIALLTGDALEGHRKFGCSQSIVKEFIADWEDNEFDGYNMTDPYDQNEVKSDGSITTSEMLSSGRKFLLKAYGTFTYNSAGDWADPEWYLKNDVPVKDVGSTPYVLDIRINGSIENIDWGTLDEVNHTYYHTYIGEGAPITFSIYDSNYSDNDGFLYVDIFKFLY